MRVCARVRVGWMLRWGERGGVVMCTLRRECVEIVQACWCFSRSDKKRWSRYRFVLRRVQPAFDQASIPRR